MKRQIFILIIPGLLLQAFLSGQSNPGKIVEDPYNPGEKIFYTVKVGPITGGSASLVLNRSTYNGQPVYHAVAEGKTVGFTDRLFNVKDIFESYFDQQTTLPYKSVRDINEGNYKRYQEAIFDHNAGTAYAVRIDSTIKVPSGILDMVSLLYYLRSLDLDQLKPGEVLKMMTLFDDELFPFDVRYIGKEDVKTKFGKIRCLRFDPVVEAGRIFRSEDDMSIWITDDKNKIPVKVRFDLIIMSLRVEIDQYANLKYPIMFTN